MEKARRFFMTDAPRLAVSELSTSRYTDGRDDGLLANDNARDLDMRFSSITGVVSTEEKSRFERMIFRATRGNCFVRFAPIKQPITDPNTGELVEKSVFIIFYKSVTFENKLKKICDAFQAHRYSLPDMDDAPAIDRMLTENAQELVDSRTVLLKNQDTRYKLCQVLAQNVEKWTWITVREKAIYHSLNMFKSDVAGMLRAEGWVIAEHIDEVKMSVGRAHANMDLGQSALVDQAPMPWPTPPTHFTTNKFTYGYQQFVNTYGIPLGIVKRILHFSQRLHSLSFSESCMEILDTVCSFFVLVFTLQRESQRKGNTWRNGFRYARWTLYDYHDGILCCLRWFHLQ